MDKLFNSIIESTKIIGDGLLAFGNDIITYNSPVLHYLGALIERTLS